MRRGQRRTLLMPGIDTTLRSGGDPVQQAQGAVVQRGVAPHQERADAAGRSSASIMAAYASARAACQAATSAG